MKKRYILVAVAILALVLVFTGCDLFQESAGGGGSGETYADLTITGNATDGKIVETIFSTTRGPGKAVMPKPETGDTYKILHDNKEVSRGGIELQGNIVTFKPSSGGSSFEAILGSVNSKYVLNFPDGIISSGGSNIGYVNSGAVNPEFDTDLDSTISLAAGQTTNLMVVVKSNSYGGAVSYQWYKAESSSDKGTAILGANTFSYTVSATATAFYYVRVTNASGGVSKSNYAKVVVGSNSTDIVVGGSSGVHVEVLPDIISYMLGGNNSLDYTVTFAEPLEKPLFISDKTFPGTGKVTIKATVPLTAGIHITRSNVVLDGLKILITSHGKVPRLNSDFCAILISKRYGMEAYMPMVPVNPEKPETISAWDDYSKFSPGKTINNVEIVDCNIFFVVTANSAQMNAIYVDPITSGRTTANRVKIKNTVVNVSGNSLYPAYCFFGNYADLSDNTFTSTSIHGVLAVYSIFDLAYGGSDATVSFTKNQFNASKGNRLAMIAANAWEDFGGDNADYTAHIVKIKPGFGTGAYEYKDLPAQYQKLIKDLFAQAPSTDGRYVTLLDISEYPNSEDYIKNGDNFDKSGG
jgi:hypothetical protein